MFDAIKVMGAAALAVALVSGSAYGYGAGGRPKYYTSPPVQASAKQTVVQPVYSFTDPASPGVAFRQKLQRTTLRGREQKITAFLRSNGLWGGQVLDIREKLKVAIELADKKLAALYRDIMLGGGAVASDSRYRAAKASRDNLSRKLQALDERIMSAIINKSTGDVAKQLIFDDEDKAAADAALGNVRQAEQNYGNQAKELLRRSNW